MPIWFVYDGGRFWIATGAASVKVRNLASTPWAVVSLESGSDPRVAEGPARVLAPPFPPGVVAGFARKYGWDITVGVDDDVGEIALVEIEAQRWIFGQP